MRRPDMHTNPHTSSSSYPAALPRTHMKGWFHLSYALPFLVLVSALVVTYQLWQDEQRDTVRALQTEFDSRVHEAGTLIEQRMKTYEQVMRGVDGLFAHAGSVTRDEFRDYIDRLRLKENYPGIQGVRFSPIVPLAQKDQHIATLRKEGFPGYTIHPEGARSFYAPVIYAEPFDERNQQVFGYDTYSDLEHPRPGDSGAGLRRAAMERARDTGQAAVTAKIRLLFETDKDIQAGFLMFMPVYKHGAPHATVAERRANIIGWISSVFRVNDLMAGILGERAAGLDTDLYDSAEISDKTLMYDPDHDGAHDLNARFHKSIHLEIAGHIWTVATYSLPGFEAQMDKGKTQLLTIGGIGASLLLTLLTWLLVHGRARALQTARKVSESEAKLQAVLDNVPTGIWLVGVDERYRFVNKTFCDAVGVPESRFLATNHLPDLLGEEVAAACLESDRACLEQEAPHLSQETITFVDGKPHLLEITKVKLRDNAGEVIGIVGIGADITGRMQAERALVESREKLYAIVDTALDAVVQMDAEGIITGWNLQAEKTFGWTRKEAIGRVLGETIIPPSYRDAHAQGMKRFLASGDGHFVSSRIEMMGLRRDGHEFPVELSVTPIKTAGKIEFNAFIRDITHKKESEDLIWKQANFDTLTQLPNRSMFHDRLEQEAKKAHRAGLTMALLFIDLDRFKEINDTLGHNMGDILLVEAARRIVECVRETDTVARLGGDEFTIILAEIDDAGSIDRVAQGILQKLAEPFQLGDEVVYISASIGITLYPEDAGGIDELLKNADQAMYMAKEKGRSRFVYFTHSMQQAAQDRLRLLNDLRGALAASQFRVYYQPIMDLATGRINKAEALIRWQHPERGMVSPAQFIPLAEETGLIVEIGDWVLREALHQAKLWRSSYNDGFQVSVNMSPVQFRNSSSQNDKMWRACLQELDLPGQSLVIEITEGLLLDAESGVTAKLLEFRDAGIQISLDDFGTGYSSLSYLKKFDIDYLKIDQSFTRNLAPGSSDMALSEAIIVMAHKLGMKVIAEGVETEAQRRLLAVAGCDYGQGYLFSKPVAAEEFEKLLKHEYQRSQSGLTDVQIYDI